MARVHEVLQHIIDGKEITPLIKEESQRILDLLNNHTLKIKCVDCVNVECEYYMVTNEVWKEAGFTSSKGIICIDCLETRIGRKLTKDDFTDAPINKLAKRMMVK